MSLFKLNELVFGHELAKKYLINLIASAHLYWYNEYVKVEPNHGVELSNLLLLGQSGTGKTHLVKSLCAICKCPFVEIDATKFTNTGNDAGIKSEDITTLINKTAENWMELYPQKYSSLEGTIARTIVFIDEFDKLCSSKKDHNYHWQNKLQASLLKFIESTRVSFIFAGSFSELTKPIESTKLPIGFFNSSLKEEKPKELSDEQLIEYGFMPELIGRIHNIVQLDIFTAQDYKNILIERIWPSKVKELNAWSISQLNNLLTDKFIEQTCNQAAQSGQGVRYLKRKIEELITNLKFKKSETILINLGVNL